MADDPGLKATVANANATPLINSIFDFSAEALGEFKTWLEANPPAIPVTQVIGFQQFAALSAPKIGTTETTVAGSYGDLTTIGPVITGVPDGQYLLLYGCECKNSAAGSGSLMSLQIDSTAATDTDSVGTDGAQLYSVAGAVTKSLSGGGNHTITAKYRVGANTGTFAQRWLIALKYANA